ncbi:hypothetical protein BDR22DRAFT_867778 [Usnea florida]
MDFFYPHLWASEEEKAELVISWSERSPGGVVTAGLTLARREKLEPAVKRRAPRYELLSYRDIVN